MRLRKSGESANLQTVHDLYMYMVGQHAKAQWNAQEEPAFSQAARRSARKYEGKDEGIASQYGQFESFRHIDAEVGDTVSYGQAKNYHRYQNGEEGYHTVIALNSCGIDPVLQGPSFIIFKNDLFAVVFHGFSISPHGAATTP